MARKTYPPMDSAVKKRWVKALRSKRYVKATGYLCRTPAGRKRASTDKGEYGFCCLGVLSDLSVADGIGEWVPLLDGDAHQKRLFFRDTEPSSIYWDKPTPSESDAGLTYHVSRWAQLAGDAVSVLVGMNDGGRSQDQIADWIEKHL